MKEQDKELLHLVLFLQNFFFRKRTKCNRDEQSTSQRIQGNVHKDAPHMRGD